MARRDRPLSDKARAGPLSDLTRDEEGLKEQELLYIISRLVSKRREPRAEETKDEKKSLFFESTRAPGLSERGATSSSVRLKEETVRRATLQAKPLALKPARPSTEKSHVPEPLVKLTEKTYEPDLWGRAAGARPKTSWPLGTSSSATSDGWLFADGDSQTRRARLSTRDVPVFGSCETFYGGVRADGKGSDVAKTPTKMDRSRGFGEDAKQPGPANRAVSPPCLFCKKEHAFKECPEFGKYPHELKLKNIKDAGLCFACLGKGHFSRECNSRLVCSVCFMDHPRILHRVTDAEVLEEIFMRMKIRELDKELFDIGLSNLIFDDDFED